MKITALKLVSAAALIAALFACGGGGGGADNPTPTPTPIVNTAPIANAGPDQSVLANALVTLDGSASSDANSDPLTYAWSLTAKPAASTSALVSASSVKPSFTADVAGIYVASLIVNDGKVNSTAASVSITASTANIAPVANAGVSQTVVAGSAVMLDGSASSDANKDALTFAWTLTAKPAGSTATLIQPASVKPSFTADVAGTYVATVVVNDGKVNSSPATASIIAVAPTDPIVPTANAARDIADTRLAFDVAAMSGTASITLAASSTPGATLEVGDLTLDSVRSGGVDLAYATDVAAKTINLALASSDLPVAVDIAFRFKNHTGFQGASADGYTFLWPYFCGNLFPCHSQPRDGMTLSLSLTGIPAGKTAIYVPAISQAPAYQLAWSIDNYTELPLGTTAAGTNVSVWYRPNELATAQAGTEHLLAVFDWYEKTLGAYRFGNKVGTVSVNWGAGVTGGMEHHPRWHVASSSLGSQETNAHEAAHGWFGDGVRISCWEDFVLSEGTASYLAARAFDVVAPALGEQTWTNYANALAQIPGNRPVWPRTCNTVDVLKDNLFTDAPYMRGAFFYKAVAGKVGADKVDQALAAFYREFAGKPAGMADMLTTIKTVTGYDPTACAQLWLEGTSTPAPAACP